MLSGLYSGSSSANTVTTGSFTIPLMKRTGLSAKKAGAIEVASSTNGQLTPPVMDAAAFLIGPCSCQVKDQNPGVDVLMAVDWNRLVQSEIDLEKELPPLSGFLASAITENSPESESPADTTQHGGSSAAANSAPAPSGDLSAATSSTMRLSVLVVGAMAAAALLMGYFFFGRND